MNFQKSMFEILNNNEMYKGSWGKFFEHSSSLSSLPDPRGIRKWLNDKNPVRLT